MSSDDESIDPVIDRLWYFDSVVGRSSCNPTSSPPLFSPKQSPSPLLSRESSLPLSTGGLSFNDLSFRTSSLTEEAEDSPSSLNPYTAEDEDPQIQDDSGELSRDDLYPWMKTLGLQYTTDGMIQIKPSHDDWNGSGNLDYSTFLLNELIDKESKGVCDEQAVSTEPRDVFRHCDKYHDGLISPEELRKTLANLGLLKNGKDADSSEQD